MIPDGPTPQLPDPQEDRRLRGWAARTSPDARRGPAYGRVRARIQAEGRLTFAAFMAEALYGPDGYYTRRPRLGGATADFFTSPELHPAFGALLGQLAVGVWIALGRPAHFDIVEHGPGTGALCRDLLTWADHVRPDFGQAVRYRLVETSPTLQAVQRATLNTGAISDARVSWVAMPSPPGPLSRAQGEGETSRSRRFAGLILANELVDALPVHVVAMRQGVLHERYVTLDPDGDLVWQEDAPSTPALAAYFKRLGIWPGDECVAEVNLGAVTWADQTADSLERGALLVLDYGYPAPDLYASTRRFGTLLTYREHTLGSDPLTHVGAQDITAHVDFTSLARAGERGGLETVGLISQAVLLRRLGLDGYLRQLERVSLGASAYESNRRALRALVESDGLGNVQALVQTRGLPDFDPFAPAGPPEASRGAPAWVPLLGDDQMRLPGPLEAEGFLDFDVQWRELVGEPDEDGDTEDRPLP